MTLRAKRPAAVHKGRVQACTTCLPQAYMLDI